MPTGVTIPPETWADAKRAIENGESYPDCAARLGIKLTTLRRTSYFHKWKSPSRRVRNRSKAEGNESVNRVASLRPPGESLTTPSPYLAALVESMEAHREILAQAAIDGPDAFKNAIKQVARSRIAESAAFLPLPRTIAEWKQMVDVLNSMDKATGPGPGQAGRHLPRLARRDPIDIEPIPECEGFRI